MSFVISVVAVATMRKEASHKSEMVSELLLGEYAELLVTTKDFCKIKCVYDGYEGWCQRVQLAVVDEIKPANLYLSKAISIAKINGRDCRISCGTPIYATDSIVSFGNHYQVQFPSKYAISNSEMEWNSFNIEFITHQYINTPYLWGGKSVFGIDCSGFTQQVFKLFNIHLLRDAYQQADMGEVIGFLQEVQCGDLAFFDNEEGTITHVGILLSINTIIHASGKVRVDKIDTLGIINSDTGERTHTLRLIKRVVKKV